MTLKSWLCDKRSDSFETPDGPPGHLVADLLDVIDLIDDYPTPEKLRAIKRLANSIREEANG